MVVGKVGGGGGGNLESEAGELYDLFPFSVWHRRVV